MIKLFVVIYVLAKFRIIGADVCDHSYQSYYSSIGDVYLTGLFDVHKDNNCTVPNTIVLQQMSRIAATVKFLNDVDYLPGLTIGLSLYDTCALKEPIQKSLIASLARKNCSIPYNLGILSSETVSRKINNISTIFDVPVYTLNYAPKSELLMMISVYLLMELNYTEVDIAVFPNADMVQQFHTSTVFKSICVKESYTFAEFNGSCPGNDLVIVIAVTSAELSPLLKLEPNCMSTFIIIIMDNSIDLSAVTENLLLHEAYIIISSNIWPEFTIANEDDFQSTVAMMEENPHYNNVTKVTMDFIHTASTVVSLLDHFKEKLINDCGCGNVFTLCTNVSSLLKSDELEIENKNVTSIADIFGIKNSNIVREFSILKSQYNVVDNFRKIRFTENDLHYEFVNLLFPKKFNDCLETNTNVYNCVNCSNFLKLNETVLNVKCVNITFFTLKSNNWVSSILTVCVIGLISCMCVFIFISIRVCKRDILEGNPSSTFLLLTATILMYVAVLPYCVVKNHKILCLMKLFGTSISYCFLFSVILSRVLMILTCDYNGSFMSHINGYLQNCMCLFMFAVQFGLTLEFWIFNWLLSNVDLCVKFDNNYFMAYLLYDVFLLIFIMSVVPFVTRSRRNYKEGLCFMILSICLLVIWICWTFCYFVVNEGWKDFFVAFGLTATATSVVVCVLIPRTYLIATGMVRDRITSALPSNISNLVDMNYRSTQALYDNVKLDFIKRQELNASFYEDPHSSIETPDEIFDVRKKYADVTVHNEDENFNNCSASCLDQRITKF